MDFNVIKRGTMAIRTRTQFLVKTALNHVETPNTNDSQRGGEVYSDRSGLVIWVHVC